ncbi:uncharacterized protein LOC127848618 isoform X2 [Dreissena polymorpha]|uniref:uncharacterized protein LOC127848618 isoform X2 n=1 Tax=Dreissena polymorpha TaxID=45954 RepID=UPI0022650D14|nr:uncharacterized protein LOC127848618 isoform X2 [Dreissena polymorpha]
MKRLFWIISVLCLFRRSDAISAWEATGFNIPTNGANAAMTLTAKVPESKMAGETMFTIAATKEQSAKTLTYTKVSGDIATVASGTGVVTVATGKSLDFETTPSYVILIKAEESGGAAAGTATVTVSIQNVLEFAKTQYELCFADTTAAGTVIGTYTVVDAVSGTDTVTYTNSGTDLIVDSTGALKVATGKTLTSATTGGYTTTITADQTGLNAAASADGTTVVKVTVGGCSGAGQIQFMAILLLIPLLITRLF